MKTLCIRVTAAMGCVALAGAPIRFAEADLSVADKAMATQLFKEGRALLEQGRIPEACQKLEESQRVDPGGGTLLNLALCHERQGRTASAWVEFTEALGIAKHDDNVQRVEFARSHLAQLEASLSRLTIQVPPASDFPELEIKRDGSAVGRAAWGSPVPVDPGDHLIEAAGAGKASWKLSVFVGPKGDTKTAVIPSLDDAPGQVSADQPAAATTAGSTAPEHEVGTVQGSAPSRREGGPTQGAEVTQGSSVPAWIALGLGVAAAGAGTYFGIRAISEKNDADRGCPRDICTAEAANQNSDAIRFANYATASFVAGGVGVGLGAILFLTRPAPRAKTETAHGPRSIVEIAGGDVTPTHGGAELRISGRW